MPRICGAIRKIIENSFAKCNLPPELLLSWTPDQLDYMHDIMYWKNIIRHCKGARVISIHEMESNEEYGMTGSSKKTSMQSVIVKLWRLAEVSI